MTSFWAASRPETSLAVQVVRGFGTAIMHGGTTTVLAMISVTLYERRPNGGLQLLLRLRYRVRVDLGLPEDDYDKLLDSR